MTILDRLDQILNSLSSIEALLNRKTSRWLTVNEAADYLKLSARSIRRYLDKGLIPQHQISTGTIRIEKRDLDSLVFFGCSFRRLTRPQRKMISDEQDVS